MRGPHGWVLNMGGAHGTPAVADDRNIVKVKPAKASRENPVHLNHRNDFAEGYILEALDNVASTGDLDRDSIDEATLDEMEQYAESWFEGFENELTYTAAEDGGRALFQARNGQAPGFNDNERPEAIAKLLTDAALSDGPFELVEGAGGQLVGRRTAPPPFEPSRRNPLPDPFVASYIETALWLSNDSPDEYAESKYWVVENVAPPTLARLIADAEAFQRAHAADLAAGTAKQGGYDLWLTRAGAGSGFWDGDWPEPQATRLTDAAMALGPFELYRGDDGKVYGVGAET